MAREFSGRRGARALGHTWPCIHEFIAVVTHPRIYRPPTPPADALLQVDYWLESPGLRVPGEGAAYWPYFKDILESGKAVGPLVHDGRVAAVCRNHGVTEIWTADRDCSRFHGIRTRNPLLGRQSTRPQPQRSCARRGALTGTSPEKLAFTGRGLPQEAVSFPPAGAL